ncbi:hypothetical protein PR048_032439 [Dryococelus australis]|uniref:Uncharacterized protein n=1 Tax=Dryococelus australis TaxID=614101 RepID=A0ABQ9G277_9NEOP|nr:hypothetical protein PR048_032439 [Dryococelus australis]
MSYLHFVRAPTSPTRWVVETQSAFVELSGLRFCRTDVTVTLPFAGCYRQFTVHFKSAHFIVNSLCSYFVVSGLSYRVCRGIVTPAPSGHGTRYCHGNSVVMEEAVGEGVGGGGLEGGAAEMRVGVPGTRLHAREKASLRFADLKSSKPAKVLVGRMKALSKHWPWRKRQRDRDRGRQRHTQRARERNRQRQRTWPTEVFEVNLEQSRNEGAGKTGDTRENPLTNGFVRHDSHLRNPVTRSGIEPGSPWWGGECANRSATAAPYNQVEILQYKERLTGCESFRVGQGLTESSRKLETTHKRLANPVYRTLSLAQGYPLENNVCIGVLSDRSVLRLCPNSPEDHTYDVTSGDSMQGYKYASIYLNSDTAIVCPPLATIQTELSSCGMEFYAHCSCALLHHRGSKLDPRFDLRSTQKTVAPFEFRMLVQPGIGGSDEQELPMLQEIGPDDNQPMSTHAQRGKDVMIELVREVDNPLEELVVFHEKKMRIHLPQQKPVRLTFWMYLVLGQWVLCYFLDTTGVELHDAGVRGDAWPMTRDSRPASRKRLKIVLADTPRATLSLVGSAVAFADFWNTFYTYVQPTLTKVTTTDSPFSSNIFRNSPTIFGVREALENTCFLLTLKWLLLCNLTRRGIEPSSPWWEAGSLTAQLRQPLRKQTQHNCWKRQAISGETLGRKLTEWAKSGILHRFSISVLIQQLRPGQQEKFGPGIGLRTSPPSHGELAEINTIRQINFVYSRKQCGTAVNTRLAFIPASTQAVSLPDFRAGRYHWSAGFLGVLPFFTPLHFGAAPHSSHFTFIGSQNRQNLSTRLTLLVETARKCFFMLWTMTRLREAHRLYRLTKRLKLFVSDGSRRCEDVRTTIICCLSALSFRFKQRHLYLLQLQWSSVGLQGQGKREVPEKTRRPAALPGTIPTCENPGLARNEAAINVALCHVLKNVGHGDWVVRLLVSHLPRGEYSNHSATAAPGDTEKELCQVVLAEKQFNVGTRRLVVRSQRDRSTSSLVCGSARINGAIQADKSYLDHRT